MRIVEISVPDEQRDAMVAVIEDHDLGYTLKPGAGEQSDHTHISFVTPADAVEHVLADLTEAGYDRSTYTTSVSTEFASFEGVDDVQEHWADTPNKIAPATLRSKAKDMRPNTRSYLWMMTLSAIVAAAGLFLSSPAVVVGSMVIAPIVGPMLTASIGAVRDDRSMLVDSVQQQVLGLGVAFVAAVLFALLVKHGFAVPTTLAVETMELISMRLAPSLLGITVGFVAGAAGSYGLATKGNVSIVGVMIAAALIPSAAAAGIGIAWGNYVLGAGALVLLLVTVSAVNLGSWAMLRYLGYNPDSVDKGLFARPGLKRGAAIAATAVVILAIVGTVTVGSAQQVAFERNVNTAATDVLNDTEYQRLGVTSIGSDYVGIGSGDGPASVTVTLRRETNESFSDLPGRLEQHITERTGQQVNVAIRFVDYYTSDRTADEAGQLAPGARRASSS